MNRQKILLDPVLPTEAETLAIKLLDKMLCLKIENDDSETLQVKLLEINGEAIALPESLYQLLCQAAHLMAAGKAVSLVPIEQDMTVEEAASLLNVSQEFVVKLLDNGEIPYGKVGVRSAINSSVLLSAAKFSRN
ncbi:MAG: helix-turn-helix domain-containing protein [Oscillatoriales cyanobacterium]|nr:MAG: helix-turn-helix domain-containing protein [Oscillatoriales cyanobacterium]